jgi:chemotaxis protein MotB
MSADNDAAVPHEVVIIRRRGGGEDDGHHGGAWKIAFADLMTAMMTFFLVMWLLSVSDKEKTKGVANYFNPTHTSAKTPMKKGIHEPEQRDEQKGGDPLSKEKNKDAKSEPEHKEKKVKPAGEGEEIKGDVVKAEEELFNDPYGVLAKLAMKAINAGDKANGGTLNGEVTLPSGDAYRNPFEPYAGDLPPVVPPTPTVPPKDRPLEATPLAPLPPGVLGASEVDPASPAAKAAQDQAAQAEVQNLEAEIMKSVADLGPESMPTIEVARVDEGLLISLTDDFRFGMFGLSSATPVPELVVVMEKVAKAIAAHEGKIVVRGHTDARPFKSGKNDNWRLSMSRAQIAYYMLVRGGIDEGRVESIEGHADRNLKVANDPNAAENRRIEILLKAPKP